MMYVVTDSEGAKPRRTKSLTVAMNNAQERRVALSTVPGALVTIEDEAGTPLWQWASAHSGRWNIVSGGFI